MGSSTNESECNTRTTPASRSRSPANGSETAPKHPGSRHAAIALIVKSRRRGPGVGTSARRWAVRRGVRSTRSARRRHRRESRARTRSPQCRSEGAPWRSLRRSRRLRDAKAIPSPSTTTSTSRFRRRAACRERSRRPRCSHVVAPPPRRRACERLGDLGRQNVSTPLRKRRVAAGCALATRPAR